MYMRPRGVYEKFVVVRKKTRIDEMGRTRVEYEENGESFYGVVSVSLPKESEKWRGTKRESDCSIVTQSGVVVEAGDMLIRVNEKYLVTFVDELPGGWKIVYAKQRYDI